MRSGGESQLLALRRLGQSAWLDHIDRELIESGELERLIARWQLGGLTSNPTIFATAIAGTDRYDRQIATLGRTSSAAEIYDRLVLDDIGAAAALFADVHERSGGHEGFVCVEVSPLFVNDAPGTVIEAERLARTLARANVMVKVPATPAGVAAARELTARGVNVNVTLLFSLERYREVASAYLDGLERAAAAGFELRSITSVASFFLSRIDAAIDPQLEVLIAEQGADAPLAKSLRGTIAIASAKRAYAMYERRSAGKRFAKLAAKGARPQRLLWASTATKNPLDSDVKYVDALVGRDTISTMPLATLAAYDDHGAPASRLTEGVTEAGGRLKRLTSLGIDLGDATERLLEAGAATFRESYDTCLAAIEHKRRAARRR